MNAREPWTRAGWGRLAAPLPSGLLDSLRTEASHPDRPGHRCLLDHPAVRDTACRLREQLTARGLLPPRARAIQAIAFDKTPTANWTVAWHQDLVFPLAGPGAGPGYASPTVKDGVHHARLPESLLRQLIAVRLHLDPCGPDNGPLRVVPGSHRLGVIATDAIPLWRTRLGETECTAGVGELLVLSPLLLHASSRAKAPDHRRVLHVVYHEGPPPPVPWHRSV